MNKENKSMFARKSTSIILSVTSLVLIVCLLVVTTYSWLEEGAESIVQTGSNISFDVDPDLSIDGVNSNNGALTINDFVLREVSSVDGKNFYVPDDTFNEEANDGKTATNELRFREANPGDVWSDFTNSSAGVMTVADTTKNKRYLSFTFEMSADTATPVYLSSSSSITTTSGTNAPDYVRIAIDPHDNKPARILSSKPRGSQYEQSVSCDAVETISNTGIATTATQTAYAFDTYTIGRGSDATSLFDLENGEKKLVTITVWLEGASGDFDDTIAGTDISAHLKFTTTSDYVNTIKVIDLTQEEWTDDDNCYMFIFDADTYDSSKEFYQNPSYAMTYDKSKYTWTAQIPQSITNIYIQRYNPESPTGGNWNTWGWGNDKLAIPGAEALKNSSDETAKENGLNCTYKILGHYDSGLKNHAGFWDEGQLGRNASTMTFAYIADVRDVPDNGQDYMSQHGGQPYISYKYKTSYNTTETLCYKMSYACDRMWRNILPATTVDNKITFCRYYNNNGTLTLGNTWSNADQSTTKKFYAIKGSGDGVLYRGKSPIYFYHNDVSYETMAAYCHPENKGGDFYKMFSTGYGLDGAGNMYHFTIVPDGREKVRFARYPVGTTEKNMSWSNYDNQANEDVTTDTNNAFKVTGFSTNEDDKDNGGSRKYFYMSSSNGGKWKSTELPNADETAYGLPTIMVK